MGDGSGLIEAGLPEMLGAILRYNYEEAWTSQGEEVPEWFKRGYTPSRILHYHRESLCGQKK